MCRLGLILQVVRGAWRCSARYRLMGVPALAGTVLYDNGRSSYQGFGAPTIGVRP